MVTKNEIEELRQLPALSGIRAKHTPYELIENGWHKNPEHEEEVLLLEYLNFYEVWNGERGINLHSEGILFIRKDFTLGRDRLDSFVIIE